MVTFRGDIYGCVEYLGPDDKWYPFTPISKPKKPNPNDTWGKNVCIHSDLSIHPKPKKSKWRNVEKDGVPDDPRKVLVWHQGEEKFARYIPTAGLDIPYNYEWEFLPAGSMPVYLLEIKLWRELPKPPKEQG